MKFPFPININQKGNPISTEKTIIIPTKTTHNDGITIVDDWIITFKSTFQFKKNTDWPSETTPSDFKKKKSLCCTTIFPTFIAIGNLFCFHLALNGFLRSRNSPNPLPLWVDLSLLIAFSIALALWTVLSINAIRKGHSHTQSQKLKID